MKMGKNNNLNTVQTYVFWNLHEPSQSKVDFSGRATNASLFVNRRIGPYICTE